MMHRLKQVRPSLLGLGLTAATSMGIGLGLSSICDDQSGMGKYYLVKSQCLYKVSNKLNNGLIFIELEILVLGT